jgi:hypothetical protein
MASERVLCTGKIVDNEIHWIISPPPGYASAGQAKPAEEPPTDGELQRLIDEAADTDEYEWDIDDRAIWRRGQW